jgi:hypothetical protein
MKLVGSNGQQVRHFLYDASNTVTTGGTAQLALSESVSRSHFLIQNLSAGSLWVEMGSARATCTVSGGAVNAVTITNAGFNFTYPPVVRFVGGGYAGNTQYTGLTQPNAPSPNSMNNLVGRPASGHAVLTAGAVSSIVIDDGGTGYARRPHVMIFNSDLDPHGCALPSATNGILLAASGGSLFYNGTACFTDAVAVYGATTGQAFSVKWMD